MRAPPLRLRLRLLVAAWRPVLLIIDISDKRHWRSTSLFSRISARIRIVAGEGLLVFFGRGMPEERLMAVLVGIPRGRLSTVIHLDATNSERRTI